MKKFLWSAFYNAVMIPVQRVGFRLLSLFNDKIRRGIRGRKSIVRDINQFRAQYTDSEYGVYIVHCASLGEYEMARPLMAQIKSRAPGVRLVLTFFSPSGYEQVTEEQNADLITYLPFDSGRKIRHFLHQLRPEKLILTSYEIWPNLIWMAAESGVEIYLTSARLRSGSMKTKPIFRSFYNQVYQVIPHIYPITEQDATNFRQIFRLPESTELVTLGNTRYDRVYERALLHGNKTLLPEEFHAAPTLIAGSVWKEDTRHLLPALATLKARYPELRIVLAPHELSGRQIGNLSEWCDTREFRYAHYTNLPADGNGHDVILIDKIGLLAELYHEAIFAFVGGAFSGSVHNVMEPAVAKCVVLFGPQHQNSSEAQELIKTGGGLLGEVRR